MSRRSPRKGPRPQAGPRRGTPRPPASGTAERGPSAPPAPQPSPASTRAPTLPRYPSLYEVNTRVWLNSLSRTLGRPATLDEIPDAELDRIAAMGFDWIWLLSVWQTGAAGRQVSSTNAAWRAEFLEMVPDLRD